MTLPSFVERQAQEADALIAANAAARNTAPEATPPASESAPEAGIPSGETPPTPVASEQHDGEDTWEHRYKVLQGKFNAQVPVLNQQVRDLRDQLHKANEAAAAANPAEVQQLRDEIERLNQQVLDAQRQPPQHQDNPVHAPHLDELRNQYGADLIDGLVAHVKQQVEPVQERLQTIDDQTQRVAKETAIDTMRRTLRELPSPLNFDSMNTDEGFNAWLGEVETLSGIPRNKLLNKAFTTGDFTRAALFFSEYANAHRQTDGRQTPAAPAAPDLSQHITVGSDAIADGNRGQQPANSWTRERIQQLYDDERRGMYRGKQAEFDRLEAEMFAATAASSR